MYLFGDFLSICNALNATIYNITKEKSNFGDLNQMFVYLYSSGVENGFSYDFPPFVQASLCEK